MIVVRSAEPLSTSVTVKLTASEKKALSAAATRAGLSMSAWSRKAIQEKLAR